jgi:acylphosphatase
MKVRVHVWISGEVQGVFFRSSVRSQAILHEVRGWVRNLPDGRVEAVFEGHKSNVDEIVEYCREGPDVSSVDRIEVKEEKPTGRFADFQIR